MKIFNQQQLEAWDEHTCKDFEIDTLSLIEEAGYSISEALIDHLDIGLETKLHIYCGPGHNGADGLVIALDLSEICDVTIFVVETGKKATKEIKTLLNRCKKDGIPVHFIRAQQDIPNSPPATIILDALLGTGISRPLDGLLKSLVSHLNETPGVIRVAVDYPTGLHPDQSWNSTAFMADCTFCVASHRLSSFFAENRHFVGDVIFVDLPLSDAYYEHTESINHMIGIDEFLISDDQRLPAFASKKDFGHGLFIGGKQGMMGAAQFASEAALRAGCGLVTAHIPGCGVQILQLSNPEAMLSIDADDHYITQLPDLEPYSALCIGCGMGTSVDVELIKQILQTPNIPKVIDADALNIIARNPHLAELLDQNCILTPHVDEFDRLFGFHSNDFERHQTLLEKCHSLGCFIVLKGRYTKIGSPDGHCVINTTGSVSIATGGSGDILAGYIMGHLAQGYDTSVAISRAVCLHGYAGDRLMESHGERGAIARDILHTLANMNRHLNNKMNRILSSMKEEFDSLQDDDYSDDFDNDPLDLEFFNNPN